MELEPVTKATLDMVPGGQDNSTEDAGESRTHTDPVVVGVTSGRHLISGLLGLNIVLLGAALVSGQAFNPQGLKHQEPQVFMLLLMALSIAWMMWYLLWARRKPGLIPHKDHHAGGIAVTVVLMLFAAFSLMLHFVKIGYYFSMKDCQPAVSVLAPFVEAPFLALQTYLLWAHSKDCIHKHKIITRSGLMVILSADLLLWLNAVTEDSIHLQIEMERQENETLSNSPDTVETTEPAGSINETLCDCSTDTMCLILRKGYEILYPFNMEYYLMAGCMLYVMWKNVGRRITPGAAPHHARKLTFQIVRRSGILLGPLFGLLVLIAGVVVFFLYQFWVNNLQQRTTAFLLFYSYHLVVMPIMSLCSVAGMLIHKLERRAKETGLNPTRSLDVTLLVGAGLGKLTLSYFSLVASLAMGPGESQGNLDLSYSILSLIELLLQNVFIIEGLHRDPSLLKEKRKAKKDMDKMKEIQDAGGMSLLDRETDTTAPPEDLARDGITTWYKRATQEICAFLIFSNVMLWIIPAFGAHPQFENGVGKEFFGFSAWFVLVNLGQPLGVFYRMHSVGALMELLIMA
ncbi:hypothetical protein DPEC_G00030450 [Dallia pectoralis]|uniref:Uncharacterized protein n=1 Tax=Dallia pectoralis TaxID=75939 RepID=A0ACC2HC36_DALPE|nr:hypothetical protein DPEC_G00030450 [Dallia pectoralis]